ncbi:hypothetical protein [Lysinibacillus xylanilyticus]|uniref:Uncharacterized protein n=1 Tax=Lysinibacillus xylanilyticus TaxID=582475 RepID=A0A2M9Q6W1_9BACI|nr:hypothetical protein [Lysinibacillus xylanilyticus]PJO43809.1 hypothetical protein CWD94_10170 [Lysinibacillus xylanilyticus]
MNTQTQIIKIEPGFTYKVVRTEIFAGVYLEVYKQPGYADEATLNIGDNEVHFAWSDEAAVLFAELDMRKPIDLLEILTQAPRLLA